MARHDSALELAYSIELNLTQSEEARLQAKRDSMARWRKKHGKTTERYPTKTTPEASAEAAKLRSTPSPEGRRKAQSLEMAQVDKARDWPQCDQCGAPRAADDGRGEPVVDHGNYLCRRCASKVGKAWFLEDPITESILKKQDDMPLYATAGVNGSGEEGNEDDGNYSNPDERPLYQKTGAWPDELWTNTDPKDRGKQGQQAVHDSEVYYNNKAALPQQAGILTHAQMEDQHGSVAQSSGSSMVRSDDRGRGDGVESRDLPHRTMSRGRDLGGQHRRGDHQHTPASGGRRSGQDVRPSPRNPGQEDSLVLGADPRSGDHRPGTSDHPVHDGQGRQAERSYSQTLVDPEEQYLNKDSSGIEPGGQEICVDCEQGRHGRCSEFCDCSCDKTNKALRSRLAKMNDWYANGGSMDDRHWHGPAVTDHNAHLHKAPSKVDAHVDEQGSTEHHKQDDPGHSLKNPRSCIYCGHQNGHSLLCDRPANKAIDLSFLGPILE